MKKALFVRKALNLKEVAETTRGSVDKRESFIVAEIVWVTDKRFRQIATGLMKDIPEIDGKGGARGGVVQAIQITNQDTGEFFLVNPEGYSYARYTALGN